MVSPMFAPMRGRVRSATGRLDNQVCVRKLQRPRSDIYSYAYQASLFQNLLTNCTPRPVPSAPPTSMMIPSHRFTSLHQNPLIFSISIVVSKRFAIRVNLSETRYHMTPFPFPYHSM